MTSTSFSLSSAVPPNPTTLRGQSTKLSVSPKGDRIIYAAGRSVVIRSLPGLTEASGAPTLVYSQHAQPVTVAKISPSGAYAASADQSGLVRFWDLMGGEQILKAEYRPFAGVIRDLAWDSESKRVAVVGEGKERFGHFFFMETGSSCGEVSGHAKVVNSVALKPNRPFRAVTGSDDAKLVFYTGVPFKYSSTVTDHTRFVQGVAYSPDGSHFASVGSDSKLIIYDGSSAEPKASVDVGAGTLFAVDFTKDGKHVLTAGADGVARLYTIEGKEAGQWNLKAGHAQAGDQLVGVAVAGELGLAVNLVGELVSFDLSQPGSTKGRYLNPTKGITAAVKVNAREILAASWDGNVYRYSTTSGHASSSDWSVETVTGYHAGGPVVTGLTLGKGGEVFAVGLDDVVRKIVSGKVDTSFTAALPAAAKGLDASTSTGSGYAVTVNAVVALGSSSSSSQTHQVPYSPTTIAVSAAGDLVAVGADDGKVYVYKNGDFSHEALKIERNRSAITALSFAPTGQHLAAGDASGKILVFSPENGDLLISTWVFHTSRIAHIAWSADGKYALTGGLDTNVFRYSVDTPTKKQDVRNAHAGGVTWTAFAEADEAGAESQATSTPLWTLGSDGALKVWSPK
ncbi:unnamed protein product [Parajaminaea phylloscopi]